MSDLQKFVDEQLKDPEFKAYWESMKLADDVSKAITAGRLRMNMTQKELAAKAFVTQADISRYENCEKLPTLKTLKRIATALGCTVRVEFVETK